MALDGTSSDGGTRRGFDDRSGELGTPLTLSPVTEHVFALTRDLTTPEMRGADIGRPPSQHRDRARAGGWTGSRWPTWSRPVATGRVICILICILIFILICSACSACSAHQHTSTPGSTALRLPRRSRWRSGESRRSRRRREARTHHPGTTTTGDEPGSGRPPRARQARTAARGGGRTQPHSAAVEIVQRAVTTPQTRGM